MIIFVKSFAKRLPIGCNCHQLKHFKQQLATWYANLQLFQYIVSYVTTQAYWPFEQRYFANTIVLPCYGAIRKTVKCSYISAADNPYERSTRQDWQFTY